MNGFAAVLIYDLKNFLKKEAKKNDVIALGCLLVQFGIHPIDSDFSSYLLDNIEEIMKRLVDIAENGNNKDSGMAYYFLGLYYEGIAKKAKNNENKITNYGILIAYMNKILKRSIEIFKDVVSEIQ